MTLCISSQWDDGCLETYARLGASEIYCSLQMGAVGSARPAVCLPAAEIEAARDHIREARRLGMSFNYIANAICLGNMEYSAEGRSQLDDYFRMMVDLGADYVTLAIPYLIELVKKDYPGLKVKVSEIANVGTLQRARYYERMGVDVITLEIAQNRNFKVLESIRRGLSPEVELELVVNAACLFQCPYHDYHNNIVGHTTQAGHPLNGYYMDYCMMRCVPEKLVHPEEIVKAPWIRPEDLSVYEEIGIRRFKISNRVGPSSVGLNCLKAYSERRVDNLADLLTPLSLEIEEPPGARRPPGFSETEWRQVVSIWAIPSPAVSIDNRQLDGFIDYFREDRCYGQCGEPCRHCYDVARRAVSVDSAGMEAYTRMIESLLHPLMSIKKQREVLTMEWEGTLLESFDRIMEDTPEAFRDVARKAVRVKAEANARRRFADRVAGEDLVEAFFSETPEVFKSAMIESLRRAGLLKKGGREAAE